MDGKSEGISSRFDWARETDRLAWALRVRWAVISGFLALALLLHPFGLFPHLRTLVAAALIGVASNTFNHFGVRRGRGRWVVLVTAIAVSLDNLLITWISARTGGFHSPLVVMYSVQVVATAMLVNARAALLSAGLAAVGGAVLVVLEARGATGAALLFSTALLATPDRAVRLGAIAWGVMLAYGLVLLVFAGGFVSERLRRSERRLEAQNRELADVCQRLQQAEAQMVHTEKMRALGQLVAGVAHELNNPISFISANIDHLRLCFARLADLLRGQAGVEPRQDIDPLLADLPLVLDDCEDGARRVKRIVAELRTFARADAQEEWGIVDLNECIQRTVRILRHHFKDGVVLDLALTPLPPVRGSAGQLEQVLLNVVVNAVEAVNGRGRVRIETGDAGGEAALRVIDDGPGISHENLARVFEPFFTTKPVGQGTGVGLSLSYAIVRRHGGELSARSIVGRGATFELRIPPAADEKSHPSRADRA